jgi:peroxidase
VRTLAVSTAALLLLVAPAGAAIPYPVRTLDGSGNNLRHPDWGRASTQYLRVAPPAYADGVSEPIGGPPARYVSNRIFNDVGQNLFSENGVSQWGWTWGQFLDHDFGLRDETPAERTPIAFAAADPLEAFRDDLGAIDFARTPAAQGTGVATPRQQVNTISSYIDGSGVYGVTKARLDWLRAGRVDGDPSDNAARLLLPGGYLPRVDARGDAAAAPRVDLMGRLLATPTRAVVAGDVRASENIALTAVHTLFAREHNRIVARLPRSLPEELKFQIARRVVGAEEQYVTYHEFLPALGVRLSPYRGYRPGIEAALGNEFAVVGYRAHSMIHGEFEVAVRDGTYTRPQLDAFRAQGIVVQADDDGTTLVIPLNAAFGNPDLVRSVGLGRVLKSLGAESQYRNDEQIDNSLRSVLFQVPKPGAVDPGACGEPIVNADCFTGVQDLGALDVERGRDHGIPSYNDLRRAYGLAPKRSFAEITGERTDRFPRDSVIDSADPANDPNILDFVELRDAEGKVVPLGSDEAREEAVSGTRRTSLAARLRAVYGSVGRLDAFVGMVSERHVRGGEFGELQLAMWKRQFEALRDGDRFFYANDPALRAIRLRYGIDYRQTLAQIVGRNTGVGVPADVFHVS